MTNPKHKKTMTRISLDAGNSSLLVDEGNLKEIKNEEDEYLGLFPAIGVRLWLNGKEYINNSFLAYGYNAVNQAEAFIERVQRFGSVDLSKWTQLDDRPFEQRYLENMEIAEREEKEMEQNMALATIPKN